MNYTEALSDIARALRSHGENQRADMADGMALCLDVDEKKRQSVAAAPPKALGATGWWLVHSGLGREAAPMGGYRHDPVSMDDVHGFTYDPQAVIDWIDEGKKPT